MDERYVEGCLERIGEDDPDEEDFLRGIWGDGDDRDFVLEALEGGWRSGRVGLEQEGYAAQGVRAFPQEGFRKAGDSSARAVNIPSRPSSVQPVSTARLRASTASKFSEAAMTCSSPGPMTSSR